MAGALIGLTLLAEIAVAGGAFPTQPGVWRSLETERRLPAAHEEELLRRLRRITGCRYLHFGADGSLDAGDLAASPEPTGCE